MIKSKKYLKQVIMLVLTTTIIIALCILIGELIFNPPSSWNEGIKNKVRRELERDMLNEFKNLKSEDTYILIKKEVWFGEWGLGVRFNSLGENAHVAGYGITYKSYLTTFLNRNRGY